MGMADAPRRAGAPMNGGAGWLTPERLRVYGIAWAIVAFAIFMGVKVINRLKREEEAAPSAPPAPSKEQELLSEIRDLLKSQQENR